MNDYTGFLYARPSFYEGMGRLLDFGNHLNQYNSSISPEQADALALYADWLAVGDDLRLAIEELAEIMSEEVATRQSEHPDRELATILR